MGHPRATLGLLFLLAGACGSGSAKPDGGHQTADGAGDRSTISIHVSRDASADSASGDASGDPCGCAMDGTTLHMSWACYCRAYGCEAGASAHTCGPLLFWSTACGLRIRSWNTSGGMNEEVFDDTGALVGIRLASDVAQYGCTGPDGGTALIVQAGQFPPASCAAQSCVCAVDGTISCPTPDGG